MTVRKYPAVREHTIKAERSDDIVHRREHVRLAARPHAHRPEVFTLAPYHHADFTAAIDAALEFVSTPLRKPLRVF